MKHGTLHKDIAAGTASAICEQLGVAKPPFRRDDEPYHQPVASHQRITVELDADVVSLLRAHAATAQVSEAEIVERALRAFDLRALVAHIRGRSDLHEDAAMELAREELSAVLADAQSRRVITVVVDANVLVSAALARNPVNAQEPELATWDDFTSCESRAGRQRPCLGNRPCSWRWARS